MPENLGAALSGLMNKRAPEAAPKRSALPVLLSLCVLLLAGGGGYYYLVHMKNAPLSAAVETDGARTSSLGNLASSPAMTPPEAETPALAEIQPAEVAVPDRPRATEEALVVDQTVPTAEPGDVPELPGGERAPSEPGKALAGAEAAIHAEGPADADMQTILKLMDRGNLDEARTQLERYVTAPREPALMGDALYRLGYIARMKKAEADATQFWKEAASTYPTTIGGRLSAVALADTYFARYCMTRLEYKQWLPVRDLYSQALGEDGAPFIHDKAVLERCKRNLTQLNNYLVFGEDSPYPDAEIYEIHPGDALSSIARRFEVNHHSIMLVNGIRNPARIRAGQRLKIIKGDCKIIVDKNRLTLTWYLNGKWIREYPCTVGPGNKTPAGTYTIISKSIKPTWRDPKTGQMHHYGTPEYPLGTRWLKLDETITDGLGIHGTNAPETVPGRVSNGCVRLLNEHVEELYAFALTGTKVIIRD